MTKRLAKRGAAAPLDLLTALFRSHFCCCIHTSDTAHGYDHRNGTSTTRIYFAEEASGYGTSCIKARNYFTIHVKYLCIDVCHNTADTAQVSQLHWHTIERTVLYRPHCVGIAVVVRIKTSLSIGIKLGNCSFQSVSRYVKLVG